MCPDLTVGYSRSFGPHVNFVAQKLQRARDFLITMVSGCGNRVTGTRAEFELVMFLGWGGDIPRLSAHRDL